MLEVFMDKKLYVPVEYVIQMLQDTLHMTVDEIKLYVKGVEVSVRKRDFENELNRMVELTTPEFFHVPVALKKIEYLDDWTREDILLTRRSFQNTVYYEQCKSKLHLLEYFYTVVEKEKREIFMLFAFLKQLQENKREDYDELARYLNFEFDELGNLRVSDAMLLVDFIVTHVKQLQELEVYIQSLQTEVSRLLYFGNVESEFDWDCFGHDDFQIVKKKKN